MSNSIAKRSHRVAICSQSDVIFRDGEYAIAREDIIQGWASIHPVTFNRFSKDGAAITNDAMKPTHEIEMNYNPDVNVSISAWIFEKRLKSPPRWFQIISVENCEEISRFWKFKVRLTEQNDDVAKPVQSPGFGHVPLPDGVNL